MMEWATVQHLDLRHVGRGLKPLQPHAAAFHPSQAIVAVAVGSFIIVRCAYGEQDFQVIDIGAPVVVMAYSPISGHTVIAILEDCTVRACDFDTEQTLVLHSPEKRTEHVSSDAEVHLALTALQPACIFGFHRRMSVTVVGTIEGGRPPTKIKTDLKKPVVNLACHPRLPVLYVAYADGLIRAYNIQTYAVHYTLQPLENIDITQILSAQDGEAVYPLPRVKSFAIHPKFNLAALLFADMTSGANPKNKAAYTREGRKQLFTVLQGARGATAAVLKEKLSSLGASGILADHQLQAQLQENQLKGQSQLTISDIARKAFLHSHFMEGHAKGGPISRLPLITISDESTILYAISGKHIGLAKLVQGYRLSGDDGQYISTKTEGKKFIKLKPNENVLQVHWHETLRGVLLEY
ncbi:hypothetical protein J5N97_025054 [Dioscorea zingiberensis]|uniref:Uncharacterized protein n=1 Tax=Dioscorea zingiberensis TaxID=325984 RepID=A0A9D5C7J9_9LILI|nr:hypothetical protein J5N97_025054 [Dioscorea zingiberensis]